MPSLLQDMLLWFLGLLPDFNFGFLSYLEPWAGYVSWTAYFVDYGFIGSVLQWLFTAEIAIDLALLVIRIWELIPIIGG